MAVIVTRIRLDTNLADEAAKILGVETRSEVIHLALGAIVARKPFKNLLTKHSEKRQFKG